MSLYSRALALLPHLIAAVLTLTYAWHVSRTGYVTTGVQFVAPLLVILAVHLVWQAGTRFAPGYAGRVLRRTLLSSVMLVGAVFVAQMVVPMPSAASGDILGQIGVVVFCVVVLAIVLGVIAGVVFLIYKVIRLIFFSDKDEDDRLNDFGTMVAVVAVLGAASLEGVDGAYRFGGAGSATATVQIEAPPEAVWAAMGTATSPAFPLPNLLSAFPQPVAVEVDEGVALGARRVVRFSGREGTGLLRLQVVERTPELVRFEAQSNSSPIGAWIGIEAISYAVVPDGAGTRLAVTMAFERKLAPAWVFGPMMKAASWGAMDVLARDVAARAGG